MKIATRLSPRFFFSIDNPPAISPRIRHGPPKTPPGIPPKVLVGVHPEINP